MNKAVMHAQAIEDVASKDLNIKIDINVVMNAINVAKKVYLSIKVLFAIQLTIHSADAVTVGCSGMLKLIN